MEEKVGFFKRLKNGLSKTRDSFVSGIDSLFTGFSEIDDDFYEELEELLHLLPGMKNMTVHRMMLLELPDMEMDGIYGEVSMEKQEWKKRIKAQVKEILKYKPEAVCVNGNIFDIYPVVHALRKKHVPVLAMVEKNGEKLLVRIPSGS